MFVHDPVRQLQLSGLVDQPQTWGRLPWIPMVLPPLPAARGAEPPPLAIDVETSRTPGPIATVCSTRGTRTPMKASLLRSFRVRLIAAVGLLTLAAVVSAQGQPMPDDHATRLVAAAVEQTRTAVIYDGSYRRIAYPDGDVPETIGVCTDVVIRAYRKVGIDLQVRVHEDMIRAFGAYPPLWGLAGPDANIDHRRVPNLQTSLRRAGAQLRTSRDASAYRAGEYRDLGAPRQPAPHWYRRGRSIAGRSPLGGSQHRTRSADGRHLVRAIRSPASIATAPGRRLAWSWR